MRMPNAMPFEEKDSLGYIPCRTMTANHLCGVLLEIHYGKYLRSLQVLVKNPLEIGLK